MYKVLIVDDNIDKINTILNSFKNEIETEKIYFDYELEIKKACRVLESNYFDLLILDIQLPSLGTGETISKTGGIDLLHMIETIDKIKKPSAIIGLTAYDEEYDENSKAFQESLWVLIKYNRNEQAWLTKIKQKISYYMKAKENLSETNQLLTKYDCAILVAVETEFNAVMNCGLSWEVVDKKDDSTLYYRTKTKNGKELILARQHQMGMVAAALLTEKMINHFHPSMICMLGIAAGREGEVGLGDIIIANESWDYGSGKIKVSNDGTKYILEPEPHQIAIDIRLKELLLRNFDDTLYEIRKIWNKNQGKKINTDIKIHMGPLASGAAVIQTEGILTEFIQPQNRKVLGIDMETYAVYYVAYNSSLNPKFLSIKAVCDFANQHKNDNYQEYSAFVSTHFLMNILDDILEKI